MQHAWLSAVEKGDAKALADDKLARVRDALVVAEEAKHKAEAEAEAEAEAANLEVERTSLLLEIGAAKDEVSSLHSQAGKDKEAMEEDYQEALELIFSTVIGVVCSNTTPAEISQRFQMARSTPPTCSL